MKNLLLTVAAFALVLAAFTPAASAQTYHRPIAYKPYVCQYYGTISGSGVSTFEIGGSATLKRGIEVYTLNGVADNRKVTFAKPDNTAIYGGTRWEFTINPYGPQCKHADVLNFGRVIHFSNCTDGHTRLCLR